MHQGKLAGMIELEAGNALATWQRGWFGKLQELSAIHERFQDILLDVVVGDIVGSRLGAQVELIAHLLLDESVAVMAADDRVRQFEIFDHRLEFAPYR